MEALTAAVGVSSSASPRMYVGPAQAVPYAGGNTVGLAGRF